MIYNNIIIITHGSGVEEGNGGADSALNDLLVDAARGVDGHAHEQVEARRRENHSHEV